MAGPVHGLPIEAYLGRRIGDVTPELGAEVMPRLEHVLRTGEPISRVAVVAETPAQSGVTRTFVHHYVPDRDDAGVIVGVSCFVRELTEEAGILRAAAPRGPGPGDERLAPARLHDQRLEGLGRLAACVAHDFSNILQGIVGFAGLAVGELAAESNARPHVERIVRAGRHGADLCRQIVAYLSRGESAVIPLDLDREVAGMRFLLAAVESKDVALEFELGGDLPAIEADPAQVRQVILNLVTNAAEALADTGGVISVSTGTVCVDAEYRASAQPPLACAVGHYVSLAVRDSGCGMDASVRARIFEPYLSTKTPGRGLGLAAIADIVGGRGGAVRVASAPGRGSTFEVLFPALSERPRLEPEAPAPDAVTWRGSGTVLLVDDSPEILEVGAQMLSALGFTALVAPTGRAALEIFRRDRDRIVCVILDLTMPGMGGVDTFHELVQIRSDVTVLLSSGYDEAIAESLAGRGVSGFLKKPYELATLASKLRGILG